MTFLSIRNESSATRVLYETLLESAEECIETSQDPIQLGHAAQVLFMVLDNYRPLRNRALVALGSIKFLEHGGAKSLAARAKDHNAAVRSTLKARMQNAAQPTPRRTLHLATAIAGQRRVHLRDEWAAVLAGDPDNGLVLTSRQRLCLVIGFLFAAVRFRARDAVRPLWAPVDWVLSVQSRSETSIALVVGAQVIYIAWSDGVHALLTYGWGWCGGCGGALYVLTRWLRRVRGIELAAVRSAGDQ